MLINIFNILPEVSIKNVWMVPASVSLFNLIHITSVLVFKCIKWMYCDYTFQFTSNSIASNSKVEGAAY